MLERYKIFPRKRLGQNFLVDDELLRRIVSYASVNAEDIVLEVGAGLGFLTKALSEVCKRVVAVEVDRRLIGVLREQLRSLRNVTLIKGDILKVSVPKFNKVVSTPPYAISSPLLFWLLKHSFECAVMTFQKEFAERLAAPVGSRNYGRLTVATYYRAEVELLELAPRDKFYPPPDVDSVVVRLKPRGEPPFKVKNMKVFDELLRELFTQRNKKVRNAILSYLRGKGMTKEEAVKLAESLLFHKKRVRELAPEDFGMLANELA